MLQRGESHRSHQQHSYLSRSRYEQQLPRYQALFGAEQLLVLRSEDLFEQPRFIWGKVFDFLGLEVESFPDLGLGKLYGGDGESLRVPVLFKRQLLENLQFTYRAMQEQYSMNWPVLT